MSQNVVLNYGDRAVEPFFDVTQEVLGASAPSLQLTLLNSTTIQAVAGAADLQQTVAIMGRYRYNTATVNRAHPGGGAATYDVFATGSDNSFSGVGAGFSDGTTYAFGLDIKASGNTPATAIYRKVGEVDWDGAQITGLRQLAGSRVDSAPLCPTAQLATTTPLRVRGASAQSAALATFENNTGTALAQVKSDGSVSTASAAGLTALALTNTGANTGITFGGDVTLYRPSANLLKTDDSLHVTLDLRHLGTNLGFYNHATATQPAARTVSNAAAALRTIDRNSFTLTNLFDVVATIISDLQAPGLFA